jgi:predicted secreted protein
MGTQVQWSTSSGGTFAAIPGVTKVSPFKIKAEHVDATAMDSSGGYREKVPTFLDAGQCVIDYNFNDALTAHTDLLGHAGETIFFKVIFPGATKTANFSGILSPGGPDVPFDNKMTAQATVEITGPVTLS